MESISFSWSQLEYPENGGGALIGYYAFWAEGTYDSEWKLFYDGGFKSSINTKDYGIKLNPKTIYKFKIHARNGYGEGPDSIVLYAMTKENNG